MNPQAVPTPEPEPCLYERLGGSVAIHAVVDGLYERIVADPFLSPTFAGIDLDWLKNSQEQFFAQALGGPEEYRGQDMVAAHRNLRIQREHFDAVASHLASALSSLGVADPLIAELISRGWPSCLIKSSTPHQNQ